MNLHELGIKHGTDKWDASHTFMDESYLHIYERYLEAWRRKRLNLLELGVRNGNSLRMWKEYFPAGNIYGLDFKPECKKHEEDRIEVLIASQNDSEKISDLARRVGGFDIIIDDASHINHLTVASFTILYPFLLPSGLYIMEDLGMSWVDYQRYKDDPAFMEGILKTHQDMGIEINHKREDLDILFRDILFNMDMNHGEVQFIHFWSKLAFIKRTKAAD